MYIAGNRKGEYKDKKQALLAQTQAKLALQRIKDEAFRNALWASDQISGITLTSTKTSIGTQTGEMTSTPTQAETRSRDLELRSSSMPHPPSMPEEPDIGDPDDSLSDIDDAENVVSDILSGIFDRAVNVAESSGTDTSDLFEGEAVQEINSYQHLSIILSNNADLIKRELGYVRPIDKDGKNINESLKAGEQPYYFKLDNDGKVKLFGVDTDRYNPSKERLIGWKNTLWTLLKDSQTNLKRGQRLNLQGTNLMLPRSVSASKRLPTDSMISQNARETPDKQSRGSQISYTDTQNKIRIRKLFEKHPWLGEARISPIIIQNDQPQYHQKYVFNKHGILRIRANGAAPDFMMMRELDKKVSWSHTYSYVLEYLEDLKQIRGDESRTVQSAKSVINIGKKKILPRSADGRLSISDLDLEEFSSKRNASRLSGRGLRGAGARKPGRPFNLRDIQGSGLASAQKYAAIGSKFIRLADLDQGKLKLVYANRTSVGRIRDISKQVVALLKEIVFDGNINESMYERLDHDDKLLFHEILKACHLNYQIQKPLKEPNEHLKGEFDKLRGQIMLGNDNPIIVKELKALAVEMYDAGLISKSDFKQISSI